MSKTSQLFVTCLGQTALQTTDLRTAYCILLYFPVFAVKATTKGMLISTCCRKTTLLVLTTHMLKQLQTERFVNPGSETPSFLGGCSQELSVSVATTKLTPFFSPRQMQSNRDFLKHIIACLRHLEPGLPQTFCY